MFPCFRFQDFQQQRQLGHFDGLRVDVHTVDVVQQDAFSFDGGQPPLALLGLVNAVLVPARGIGHEPVAIPIQQVLVGDDQKRAAATGRIQDPQRPATLGGLPRRGPGRGLEGGLAFQQFAHGVLDDVFHDIGRRVIDSSRLFHFRLIFHHRPMARCQANDLAQNCS